MELKLTNDQTVNEIAELKIACCNFKQLQNLGL